MLGMSRVSITLLLLAFTVSCFAEELPRIRGVEAEAVSLAVQSSKRGYAYKDQQGWPVYGDLRHYSIQLERHPKEFEIIFVPDADPGSRSWWSDIIWLGGALSFLVEATEASEGRLWEIAHEIA